MLGKIVYPNSRSVMNKAAIVKDFVIANNIDILCLTETWLNTYDGRDEHTVNEITSKGFLFSSKGFLFFLLSYC